MLVETEYAAKFLVIRNALAEKLERCANVKGDRR